MDTTTLNSERRQFSIKLWPPSNNTRKMLVERMSNNLSNPSVFTKKYGSLSKEEAIENAKHVEDVAFAVADQHHEKEPDGDGGSAVQLYAKECSKLLLDVLKGGYRVAKKEKVIFEELAPEVDTVFDLSKGERAFIGPEEAGDLLKPLEEPGNSYTKICFSNRSFGRDAARVAEPILVSLKDQLKDVDLSDFIAGRAEDEALEVMQLFSEALEGCILRSLNLSNNAMGEKGIRAFEALLKSQNSLEELYLMNDGISEEAARAVCELIPSTEKLRVLQFHNNMTGDEGAFAISDVVKRSPLLEDFRCSSTRVDSEGGIALSQALEVCSNLKKLDLRDNMFGTEAGLALSKTLSLHACLTEVYLSYLNLEDDGSIAIVTALKESSCSLKVLDLTGNDMTVKASPALAACIAAKQQLTKLYLAENELKDGGAIDISNALTSLLQLEELDMSTNLMGRAGARLLAQTVIDKPGFKLLNINANFISDEGIDEVKKIFKKSPSMLGPLDENDPEGEDDNGESGEDDKGDEDELDAKLQNLDVNKDDE